MERSGSSESTGGNCPQKARVHVPTRMLRGFSAPKFNSTECGDEQWSNIQVRLCENPAGVPCPFVTPPPAPVSVHNATFTAAGCILLSLLSNESFVTNLNKQPGKEYNYSGRQVGSQKIKKKKKHKPQHWFGVSQLSSQIGTPCLPTLKKSPPEDNHPPWAPSQCFYS